MCASATTSTPWVVFLVFGSLLETAQAIVARQASSELVQSLRYSLELDLRSTGGTFMVRNRDRHQAATNAVLGSSLSASNAPTLGAFERLASSFAAAVAAAKRRQVERANGNVKGTFIVKNPYIAEKGDDNAKVNHTDPSMAVAGGSVSVGAPAAAENDSHTTCPSMFVAVLSTGSNFQRRELIRDMWHTAHERWGNLTAKFAVCGQGIDKRVQDEAEAHGDMLLMNCSEGYLNGKLTRKILATMRAFLQERPSYSLFMKTDDDTFVSTRRICGFLNWRSKHGMDNTNAYMGVFAEGIRENLFTKHRPCRDPTSPWFEPRSKFAGSVYPVSAKGGPGYILPRTMVERIVEEGIAEKNELRNEDKAVGVWVDLLAERGVPIEYVNLPGTDGYSEHADSITLSGPYKDYPHYLHHHLQGETIACLHRIDRRASPNESVDACFASNTSA